MLYLSENLKKFRLLKNLTQEDVAEYLGITPQSVSKWERAECYPDITFLPALANIFETSVDMLLGMDIIRDEQSLHNIHKSATEYQRNGDNASAENVYRDALKIYPNDAGMLLGLAGVLALSDKTDEAITLMERGLPLCESEKQKAVVMMAENGNPVIAITKIDTGNVTVMCDEIDEIPGTKIYLAAYDENGVLTQIKAKDAEKSVIFENVSADNVLKAFLWSELAPESNFFAVTVSE